MEDAVLVVLVGLSWVVEVVDVQYRRNIVFAEIASCKDDCAILGHPRWAVDFAAFRHEARQWGEVTLEVVLPRVCLEGGGVGHVDRTSVLEHSDAAFVRRCPVGPQHRVLAQVDRFGLRRPVGVQLDELGHRGADVRGVHLDGDRLREEAVERNLAGVRSDRNLRSDESVDPHPVDVAPVVVLDQDDIGSVDRRAESSGHRRVGGLASDLDRESRDLGLRRFDDVDLVGRRRRGVALGAARQGENRGQERREEVTYHDPTPLRRSYWPVIFVSGIAHDRHRLTHQTRLVEKV